MFENIPQSIIGFIITGLFIWQFTPVAKRIGLVDRPGGHKVHQGLIPVIGGIGMFTGILVTLILLNFPWAQINSILFAGLMVLIVGILDDKLYLSSTVRFTTQIGAALIIITGDSILLFNLGHLVSENTLHLGGWAIPLTVFAIVGVINAFNMTDGLDGLAGGLSIVTLLAVTLLLSLNGTASGYFIIPMVFIAAVSGFLMYNMRTPWLYKAKVYMGNGGSMLLGILLAWLLIKFSQGSERAFDPVIALWIFAVPLLDTVTIMLRRIKNGKSPFSADREHLHHLFLALGFTVGQSVTLVLIIAASLASIGILSSYFHATEHVMFFTFLSLFAAYFWGMDKAWSTLFKQKAATFNVTGGTDNSIINPLKRERNKD